MKFIRYWMLLLFGIHMYMHVDASCTDRICLFSCYAVMWGVGLIINMPYIVLLMFMFVLFDSTILCFILLYLVIDNLIHIIVLIRPTMRKNLNIHIRYIFIYYLLYIIYNILYDIKIIWLAYCSELQSMRTTPTITQYQYQYK